MSIARTAWLPAAALAALAVLAPAPPASAEPAVDLGGAPVPGGGSTEPDDPTPLEAGLWADSLGPPDSSSDVRHYSYDRTMADSTVRFGVVAAADADAAADAGDNLEIAVTLPDGTSCETTPAYSSYPGAAFGDSLAIGPDTPGERDAPCLTAETLRLSVSRSAFGDADTDLPVAVKIAEEAPLGADALADLPRTEDQPRLSAPDADGEAQDGPAGAASFDDAPVVDDGTRWTASVPQGEQRLWRMRLGWGQGLSVETRVPAIDKSQEGLYTGVELGLYSPLRGTLDALVDGEEPTGAYSDEPARLRTGLPPVAYLARFDTTTYSTPGDFWVSVAVQPADEGDEPVDVPVELALEVTGEVTGDVVEPGYAEVVTSPGGGAGPEGYAPSTPFLVGAGTFAADPSGNPDVLVDGDDAAAPGSSSRRWWGAGLGVVSLLCCAAGAWRLRSARPAG